jgi:hypothetical protein
MLIVPEDAVESAETVIPAASPEGAVIAALPTVPLSSFLPLNAVWPANCRRFLSSTADIPHQAPRGSVESSFVYRGRLNGKLPHALKYGSGLSKRAFGCLHKDDTRLRCSWKPY